MLNPEQWFAIINPAADNGNTGSEWDNIESLIHKAGLSAEAVFTEHKYHAVELTVDAISRGFRKIIVVGGDATLHEVVNGLFIQKSVPASEVTIGIIPAMSIHRHARLKAIPSEYPEAVAAIASGYFSMLDIIAVSYHKANYRQTRHIITSARIGMDANIVKRMSRLREEGKYGRLRQWITAVRLIYDYRQTKIKLHIDGHNITLDGFTSGIVRIPKHLSEQHKNGCMEIATLGSIKRWWLIFSIKKLRCGSIYSTGKAFRHYGRSIRLDSDYTTTLSADGETLGYSPIEFTTTDEPVRIIFPPHAAEYDNEGVKIMRDRQDR